MSGSTITSPRAINGTRPDGLTAGRNSADALPRLLRADRRSGPIVLQIARRLSGKDIDAVWPSSILPRKRGEGPILSWFSVPLAALTARAWIESIDVALAASGTDALPDVSAQMQRFIVACALDPVHRIPRCIPELGRATDKQRVLLIDERASGGRFDAPPKVRRASFQQMLSAAVRAHPDAEFWLAQSSAHGYGPWLSRTCELPAGIRHFDSSYALGASLPHVEHVYTVAAPEGLHAMMCDTPVHVFGTPYYAGWGMTHDHCMQPERRSRTSLAALFHVVFVRFARHLDPATHELGTLDALLDSIALQRAVTTRYEDLRHVAAIRFQWWKRPLATPYLTAGGGNLRWVGSPSKLLSGEHAALWGARNAEGLPDGAPMVRIEDGFLHSTGLGSDMIAPQSQVIDRRGLYFDPARPSDLTALLNDVDFPPFELTRAAALRAEIVSLGLTKYNLGRRAPTWRAPANKCIILVPGQVADDASIRLGTRGITTSEALLHEVRARRPDAFIVYKPHPDVLSGNRAGLVNATRLADAVDVDSDLISLIEVADEVHTLSSLAGFDALLRGKSVFTYGLPFYAGWGLTRDALEQPWRKRPLSLDMLTAGALLRYPLYWDWKLRLYTTPEAVVRRLAKPAGRPLGKIQGNPIRPLLKIVRWTRNALRHAAWQIETKQGPRRK
ncbi:capsule polysaccharide export protein [Burkholderia lata]|uniref:capsular polysaccharide biosynthesis protein n=1 Tax=Burkholderia lata (strain ATCC 17760 / DSM 23089 / LMG 22485 / NCIMB 9086 / R18194 / 383) TaxID=482957 RepID=UPI001453434F|nr:capsular biosynthesis protein [Burkholderia lata]VWB54398.1 capsule polysaccharide export protein [Burkholderia lata]